MNDTQTEVGQSQDSIAQGWRNFTNSLKGMRYLFTGSPTGGGKKNKGWEKLFNPNFVYMLDPKGNVNDVIQKFLDSNSMLKKEIEVSKTNDKKIQVPPEKIVQPEFALEPEVIKGEQPKPHVQFKYHAGNWVEFRNPNKPSEIIKGMITSEPTEKSNLVKIKLQGVLKIIEVPKDYIINKTTKPVNVPKKLVDMTAESTKFDNIVNNILFEQDETNNDSEEETEIEDPVEKVRSDNELLMHVFASLVSQDRYKNGSGVTIFDIMSNMSGVNIGGSKLYQVAAKHWLKYMSNKDVDYDILYQIYPNKYKHDRIKKYINQNIIGPSIIRDFKLLGAFGGYTDIRGAGHDVVEVRELESMVKNKPDKNEVERLRNMASSQYDNAIRNAKFELGYEKNMYEPKELENKHDVIKKILFSGKYNQGKDIEVYYLSPQEAELFKTSRFDQVGLGKALSTAWNAASQGPTVKF